jgi:hypothetical protein
VTVPGGTLDLARKFSGHCQGSSLARSSRVSSRLNQDFHGLGIVFPPLNFQATPELDFRQCEQAISGTKMSSSRWVQPFDRGSTSQQLLDTIQARDGGVERHPCRTRQSKRMPEGCMQRWH